MTKIKGRFSQPISEIKNTDQIEYTGTIPACISDSFDCDPTLTEVLELLLSDHCDEEAIDISTIDISCLAEVSAVPIITEFDEVTWETYQVNHLCNLYSEINTTNENLENLLSIVTTFYNYIDNIDFSCLTASEDMTTQFQALVDAACTALGISITADNGLTELSGNIQLGGILIQNTEIDANGNNFDLLNAGIIELEAENFVVYTQDTIDMTSEDTYHLKVGNSAIPRVDMYIDGDSGYWYIGKSSGAYTNTISSFNGSFSFMEMIGIGNTVTHSNASSTILGRVFASNSTITENVGATSMALTLIGNDFELINSSAAILGSDVSLTNVNAAKTPFIIKLGLAPTFNEDALMNLDNPFVSVFNHYVMYTNTGLTEGILITDDVKMKIGTISDGLGTAELPSSALDVEGDVEVGDADAYYMGDPTTNNSWRIRRSGNDLFFERREAGIWVNKNTITA